MFQVFTFYIWADGAACKGNWNMSAKPIKERATNPAAILNQPVTGLNVSDMLFAFVFVRVFVYIKVLCDLNEKNTKQSRDQGGAAGGRIAPPLAPPLAPSTRHY